MKEIQLFVHMCPNGHMVTLPHNHRGVNCTACKPEQEHTSIFSAHVSPQKAVQNAVDAAFANLAKLSPEFCIERDFSGLEMSILFGNDEIARVLLGEKN